MEYTMEGQGGGRTMEILREGGGGGGGEMTIWRRRRREHGDHSRGWRRRWRDDNDKNLHLTKWRRRLNDNGRVNGKQQDCHQDAGRCPGCNDGGDLDEARVRDGHADHRGASSLKESVAAEKCRLAPCRTYETSSA